MFKKVKMYFALRYMKAKNLYNIKRYERRINRAWKMSLNLPEEKRYEIGEKLLYHEANLRHLKELFASQM